VKAPRLTLVEDLCCIVAVWTGEPLGNTPANEDPLIPKTLKLDAVTVYRRVDIGWQSKALVWLDVVEANSSTAALVAGPECDRGGEVIWWTWEGLLGETNRVCGGHQDEGGQQGVRETLNRDAECHL
jgi:hypothetical protein